jgi:hypothetical protein
MLLRWRQIEAACDSDPLPERSEETAYASPDRTDGIFGLVMGSDIRCVVTPRLTSL